MSELFVCCCCCCFCFVVVFGRGRVVQLRRLSRGAISLGVVTDIVKCQLLLHFTSSCVVAVHRVSLPDGG